jgi:hypothetical protein
VLNENIPIKTQAITHLSGKKPATNAPPSIMFSQKKENDENSLFSKDSPYFSL